MDELTPISGKLGRAMAQPGPQLIVGVICMACVANLQYGWTLFVPPLEDKFHWARSAIQVAFTVFIVLETWLIPVEGYLVDRFGPRWVIIAAAVLVALSWALDSVAESLPMLYLAAALGGIGTGCVYGTCVGNALKWFPGRRGFATGITVAGFGAGAAITVGPIASMIRSSGYEQAFLVFGLIHGGIVFLMAWLMEVAPSALMVSQRKPDQSARAYTPAQVLRSPIFWVMYAMFVLAAAGGLTMAASIGPMARDLAIENQPVQLLGVTMPALVFALALNRILDGAGRPLFGWLSDYIGREHTMALAFVAAAGALLALSHLGSHPTVFVLVTGIYLAAYGQIFSVFPATQADTFGSRYAAANSGMLYTAKGSAALLVPVAAVIARSSGWDAVFMLAMGFTLLAAMLALIVLKPLRARHFALTPADVAEPAEIDADRGAA